MVREDGTYCRTVRVLYVLPFSRSSSQHGFKQFLRVSPFLRLFLRRLTRTRCRAAVLASFSLERFPVPLEYPSSHFGENFCTERERKREREEVLISRLERFVVLFAFRLWIRDDLRCWIKNVERQEIKSDRNMCNFMQIGVLKSIKKRVWKLEKSFVTWKILTDRNMWI